MRKSYERGSPSLKRCLLGAQSKVSLEVPWFLGCAFDFLDLAYWNHGSISGILTDLVIAGDLGIME